MNKFVSIFIIFILMSVSCFADGLTATLQKGAYMKPFYGVDAFKNALAEAEDSCVITLSPGLFNTVDSIKHSVTVRGTYGFTPSKSEATILPSLGLYANKITIEGVHVSGDCIIGGVSDSYIKRCYINGTLKSTDTEHTNTLINQCAITKDEAIKNGKNYCIRNTTIGSFGATNTVNNVAYISNCFINVFKSYYSYYATPFAIFRNNILGIYTYRGGTLTLSSPSEFYNNVYYRIDSGGYSGDVSYSTGCKNSANKYNSNYSVLEPPSEYPNLTNKYGNGDDGTPIGVTGGPGFNEYPAMPRITSAVIDPQTDAEGKIKAKITVKVEQ